MKTFCIIHDKIFNGIKIGYFENEKLTDIGIEVDFFKSIYIGRFTHNQFESGIILQPNGDVIATKGYSRNHYIDKQLLSNIINNTDGSIEKLKTDFNSFVKSYNQINCNTVEKKYIPRQQAVSSNLHRLEEAPIYNLPKSNFNDYWKKVLENNNNNKNSTICKF